MTSKSAYQDIKDGKTDHERSAYRDIRKPKPETRSDSETEKKPDSDLAWSDGTKSRGFSK